jgi:hypothetical protein
MISHRATVQANQTSEVSRDGASVERRAALDRMVEIADEADLYARTATPKRTR